MSTRFSLFIGAVLCACVSPLPPRTDDSSGGTANPGGGSGASLEGGSGGAPNGNAGQSGDARSSGGRASAGGTFNPQGGTRTTTTEATSGGARGGTSGEDAGQGGDTEASGGRASGGATAGGTSTGGMSSGATAAGGATGGTAGQNGLGGDNFGGTNASGGDAGSLSEGGSTGSIEILPRATANLFVTLLDEDPAQVEAKVSTAVNRFFGIGTGEKNELIVNTGYRCYFELPQNPELAFIWAPDTNDIRSEGMSYGMMIAVQMNLQTPFDKLWRFAKTKMQYTADTDPPAWRYYFRWQSIQETGINALDPALWKIDYNPTTTPAPDGEEYFAAALYLAHKRWGSAGAINYLQEANALASAMLHNASTNDDRHPIIHPTQNMVVFVPYGASNGFTDPSYHLPAFYELFAERGPQSDRARWKNIAQISRTFLAASAHPSTGLHPDYATFAGAPRTAATGDGHDRFKYDAWRVPLNMALDYAWFSADPGLKAQLEKYQAFFTGQLVQGNVSNSLFAVDGSAGTGGGSTALTATLAAASLGSAAPNRAQFVRNLWLVDQQSGKYRYYQQGVYLLGLLATAGKFRTTWE
ncbi:MAG TPA: glycosyl hydrolase family 8 [Polyangiaceae bacterium]|nr:glycosyl hydrolase family 8 [Polyangiaceae bacterium]